jgi:hypothetical protein
MNIHSSLDLTQLKMEDYHKLEAEYGDILKEKLDRIQEQCPHLYVEQNGMFSHYTQCALCGKVKTSE